MPIASRGTGDACVVPLVVLAVDDDLDMTTAPLVRARLERVVTVRPRLVVLDLSQCPFVDACGVTLLLQAAQRVRAAGGQFSVCHPGPTVRRVLEATEVIDVLRVTPPHRPVHQSACGVPAT